jgi:CubicO group peptidase (beta-lactamase class C family)
MAATPQDGAAIAQLDGFALGLAHAGAFSGVVLVAEKGETVFERAYGKSDEKSEALNTPETCFNLASAGKMFTTVAVLQQVARGRMTLDTKVGEVLKDYTNREFADKVTVRHLLTHTAGAGDIDLFGPEGADNRERARSVADMVALHAARAPSFEPGSAQQYGNFGYVVLGRMVEVLSGMPFEEYVRRNIFVPAGMNRTSFEDCLSGDPDIAKGYVTIAGARERNCATLPRRGFPAGGQVSTASDMQRFVQALQDGSLLPRPLFAEATRTQREFMGLGLFATGYGPGVPERDFRWGHGGSADGICTDVRTYPHTGETIVVLANVDAPSCYAVSNFLHEQWNLRHPRSNVGR